MPTKTDPVCREVNAGELGRILGVSRRAIYKRVEQGMPRNGRMFDVAECVQWQIAAITAVAGDEPEDIMEARKRLYVAQTQKTLLEASRLRGNLVDLEEARGLMIQIASLVASQLDAVGPRIASLVAAETDIRRVQELLFDEHRAIRESLANAVMDLPAPGRESDSAPAEADGGPMGGRESIAAA